MTLRRGGALGGARQGRGVSFVSGGYGRDRGRGFAASHRGPTAQGFVLLEAPRGLRAYAESVLSRKPPWYSYEEPITASASREARRPRPRAAASAIGLRNSASIPLRPAGDSEIASARQFAQTAPPALGE